MENVSGGGASQKRSSSVIEAADRINVTRYKVRCLCSMFTRMAGSADCSDEDGFLNGMSFLLEDIDESLSEAESLL